MSRTARTYLLFAVFVALLGGVLAGALSVMPPLPAAQAVAVPAVELQRIDAIPADAPAAAPVEALAPVYVLDEVDRAFLAELLGPDTDYSDAHVQDLAFAAHRVCEAHTAEVPTAELVSVIAAAQGWTADEATAFIAAATATVCVPV